MQIRRNAMTWLLAALTTISLTSRATAAPTPAQTCQAAKTIAAGKYATCLQTAEAKDVLSPDAAKRATAIAACGTKLQAAWAKAEAKASAQSASCPSSGDVAAIQSAIDVSSGALASSLGAGAPLLPPARPLKTGQVQCFSTTGSGAQISCAGSGQDAEFQAGLARSYGVIGYTIKDRTTGLEWEKLSDDDTIDDVDNGYFPDEAMAKIAQLNASLYAGHDDWRLPNVLELQTLIDYGGSYPAVSSQLNQCFPGCTQLICSCTAAGYYWTSTPSVDGSFEAYVIDFRAGDFFRGSTLARARVRAVRGGL